MSPTFEEARCGACGSDQSRPFLRKRGFGYRRCLDCGHVYVSPRWTKASAMERIYAPTAYHLGTGAGFGGRDKTDAERAASDAREHLRRIRRVTGVGSGALFEVGCSAGRFLEAARAAGFAVAGCDLASWAAEQARRKGLSVSEGELRDAQLAGAGLDLVVMWEVLEHLFEPRTDVSEIFRVLRPGGWFAFFTMNQDSWTARRATRSLLRGETDPFHWYRPEQHIQHFTPETLRRLLGDAGFEPVVIELARSAAGLERMAARLGVSAKASTSLKRYVRRYLSAPKRALASFLARFLQGELLYGFARRPAPRNHGVARHAPDD